MSDLHLEVLLNRNCLDKSIINPEGDILVLAGDMFTKFNDKYTKSFLQKIRYDFPIILQVPGNHCNFDKEFNFYHPRFENVVLYERNHESKSYSNNEKTGSHCQLFFCHY